MDLTEFLLARIAEDEAAARGAYSILTVVGFAYYDPDLSDVVTRELPVSCTPARVLAECEAKRRIVEECQGSREQGPSAFVLGEVVLGYLALPYANHPDYRDEWKP